MTKLLEQAIEEAKKLPETEQDALAQRLLLALDEQRWNELFARPESEQLLSELADEALAEFRFGKTTKVGPDDL